MKTLSMCCLLATLAAAQAQTKATSCDDGSLDLWERYECQNRISQPNVGQNCQVQVTGNKPEPAKETRSEASANAMTLWGITLGAAPPTYPECRARRFAMHDFAPCSERSRIMPQSLMVHNLIYKGSIPVDLNVGGGIVNSLSAQIIECQKMAELLSKKLGDAKHESQPMINGVGSRWTADIWSWTTEDGSKAILTNRLSEMTDADCQFLALSPSAALERTKSADATAAAEP